MIRITVATEGLFEAHGQRITAITHTVELDPTEIVHTVARSANATQFTMNTGVAYGAAYALSVQSPPTGLVCSVSNGTGTMGAADVASVSIACVSNFGLLYSFTGGSGDAADPYHTLIQGSDGDFYGTTLAGGTSNAGTIFKVTQSGSESVFYSFASIPYSGLVQSSDRNIYGSTDAGGTKGFGTFFKVALQ